MQHWPIPHYPWEEISMDFITGLPLTVRKHNACLVVVDRLSKQCHFIAAKNTIDTSQCAQLFMEEIFRLHGLPCAILTNRDTRFTSHFWSDLMKIIDVKLQMGTAYHSSTDEQS